MSWTDERVETLRRMWADGQSASQIAKELGGVTRNAVIGKVHRLGLSNRGPGANGAPRPPGLEEGGEEDLGEVAAEASAAGAAGDEAADVAVAAEEAGDGAADPAAEEAGAAPPEEAAATADEGLAALAQPPRRPAVIAGQPLPPQPSAGEISPETLASAREVEKRARRLTLMELTERTCKWPVGDPATADFWFCGLPVLAGKPYCETHVQVAFQPMSARRDRRR